MMNFLILINMLLNSSMMFMKHPLSLGLLLLIQSLLIAIMSGMIAFNYWFSYILFLIFLGGLLILFIYITTLIPNMIFKYNLNYFLVNSIIFILMFIFLLKFKYYFFFNSEMMTFKMFSYMENIKNLFFFKLFNNHSFKLTLMLIIYLLITLIVMLNINKPTQGPLRKMN
uniref:NADH dehydrogenase subunit 6 n=1 Tax=Agapetus zniachtl TaxID=1875106 RepID=UPI0022DCDC29|nr:NADH dehydrogenase subunit 6 [Agapetus zniachtl]UZZ43737.1 NADH dehydrogenase subunit 6 [Agapetus zniachtl]